MEFDAVVPRDSAAVESRHDGLPDFVVVLHGEAEKFAHDFASNVVGRRAKAAPLVAK